MHQILIVPSKTADTRTADKKVTLPELYKSSLSHIDDVGRVMDYFKGRLEHSARRHDFTKIESIDLFHRDFAKAQDSGVDFRTLPWYKMHVAAERHHLNDHVPPDVNLFDVLERIADITAAAMARNGKFTSPAHIDPAVLVEAYHNTIKLVLNRMVLQDEKQEY